MNANVAAVQAKRKLSQCNAFVRNYLALQCISANVLSPPLRRGLHSVSRRCLTSYNMTIVSSRMHQIPTKRCISPRCTFYTSSGNSSSSQTQLRASLQLPLTNDRTPAALLVESPTKIKTNEVLSQEDVSSSPRLRDYPRAYCRLASIQRDLFQLADASVANKNLPTTHQRDSKINVTETADLLCTLYDDTASSQITVPTTLLIAQTMAFACLDVSHPLWDAMAHFVLNQNEISVDPLILSALAMIYDHILQSRPGDPLEPDRSCDLTPTSACSSELSPSTGPSHVPAASPVASSLESSSDEENSALSLSNESHHTTPSELDNPTLPSDGDRLLLSLRRIAHHADAAWKHTRDNAQLTAALAQRTAKRSSPRMLSPIWRVANTAAEEGLPTSTSLGLVLHCLDVLVQERSKDFPHKPYYALLNVLTQTLTEETLGSMQGWRVKLDKPVSLLIRLYAAAPYLDNSSILFSKLEQLCWEQIARYMELPQKKDDTDILENALTAEDFLPTEIRLPPRIASEVLTALFSAAAVHSGSRLGAQASEADAFVPSSSEFLHWYGLLQKARGNEKLSGNSADELPPCIHSHFHDIIAKCLRDIAVGIQAGGHVPFGGANFAILRKLVVDSEHFLDPLNANFLKIKQTLVAQRKKK